MAKLDVTATLFSKDEANDIAETMNEIDNLIYTPKHNLIGSVYSIINIFDKNNVLLGQM